jgi:hypothetical protein
MSRLSLPALQRLPVHLPQGHDGYWRIMRELDRKQGEFTIADVSDYTNVSRDRVDFFVLRLVRGGYLKVVAMRPNRQKVYRLLKKQTTAPCLRADGTPFVTAADRLWRAMRTPAGRTFTGADLAFEASTPESAVPKSTAITFIGRLSGAGYLTRVATGVWRLKPSMNTGPLPPAVLVVRGVWDRNRKEFMSSADVATEVEI